MQNVKQTWNWYFFLSSYKDNFTLQTNFKLKKMIASFDGQENEE